MFLDEKKLTIQAGRGGDGVALFRREKYVPRGGPDGGDGGNGGSIYIEGSNNLHTLTHLAYLEQVKADDGDKGGHRRSSGKSGEDVTFTVPPGTQVLDENGEVITEITASGERFLLAKGGSGGWGNWHFRTSVQQAPTRFNEGLEGEKRQVTLVLKLIADIGLIGLPNAGKSTLLSVISAAEPKIADYPFTTLEPQLGVASWQGHTWVVADLPGLIEGASGGKGLGITFLKHVERTHLLVHCISIDQTAEEICAVYDTVRQELLSWSKELSKKPEIIVLTKADLALPEEVEEKKKKLKKHSRKDVISLSAATHAGLEEFYRALPLTSTA